jgi:two-component system CheB/CheR fusion protein
LADTFELVEASVLQALEGPPQSGGSPSDEGGESPSISAPDRAGTALPWDDIKEHLDEALTVIGHQLQTPLSNLQLCAEWLSGGSPADERYPKVRALLNDQAWSISKMIDDLLDLARLATNAITVKRETVNLDALLRDRTDQLVRRTPERYITYHGLPSCFLKGDSLRLSQAFDNLLYDVVKYSPPETAIELTVKQAEGEQVLITVENRDYALTSEEVEHVFQPFYRARHRQDGLGIGPFLAKSLIELHRGRIWVRSTTALGTRFFIELPGAQFKPVAPGDPDHEGVAVDGVVNHD